MRVVLLCGGYGTRIRDVADDLPKPMIPVGGMPIVWHIMKHYAHFGHKDFVLCLGYKGQVLKDFFLNYEVRTNDFTVTLGNKGGVELHTSHDESGWQITAAETGPEAMTGARVRKIKKYIGSDANFMLTYGDGVADIDLKALLRFHEQHGRLMTVTGVRPPGRFGEITSEPGGQVRSFNEKPQVSGGRISGGFFVCRREIFDYLPEGDDLVLEEGPLNSLARDKQLMVFEHEGFWHPMDTFRDYKFLNSLCEKGKAPWQIWR